MRVVGYIDGMNFYEASKDQNWYPAGWCNWSETLAEYCPGSQVTVRYFTALYTGNDRNRARRQQLHLLAMKEVAKAEIIHGTVRGRPLKCPECKKSLVCACGCSKRWVEKMTDVNIAVRLVEDAVDGAFDRAYLVTGDLDLLPAIHSALRRAPACQVFWLHPPDMPAAEEFRTLEQEYPRRSKALRLDIAKLKRFPDDLPRRWGMTLPRHWRADAGKRRLDQLEGDSRRPRSVPWHEESVGYGSKQGSKTR